MCFSAFACLLCLNEAGIWALVAILLPIFSYAVGVIRNCTVNLGQENKETIGKRNLSAKLLFTKRGMEGGIMITEL